MPTAPKTYHYHFIYLTYLLYLFVMPTPYSTIQAPTHLPPQSTATLPDARQAPASTPPIPPRSIPETTTKKDQKQASHRRDGKARPHPAPSPPEPTLEAANRNNGTANPTSPAALYRESGGTRRALPEPVSGEGREGNDQKKNKKSIKKKTVILPFLWCG